MASTSVRVARTRLSRMSSFCRALQRRLPSGSPARLTSASLSRTAALTPSQPIAAPPTWSGWRVTTVTACPAPVRAWQRAAPMKPVPPVTRTRIAPGLSTGAARSSRPPLAPRSEQLAQPRRRRTARRESRRSLGVHPPAKVEPALAVEPHFGHRRRAGGSMTERTRGTVRALVIGIALAAALPRPARAAWYEDAAGYESALRRQRSDHV